MGSRAARAARASPIVEVEDGRGQSNKAVGGVPWQVSGQAWSRMTHMWLARLRRNWEVRGGFQGWVRG